MGSTGPIDPAWKVVPKGKQCLLIWRIENMKVVAVPRDQFGNFYKGDAYIIYAARMRKGRFETNIHFWLGQECSQDEEGAAAIKTVELDDYLGGGPVQHRETQGHESQQFLSYFKCVKYSNGGVASGFKHVDRTIRPGLYQVKGKHSVRVTEITNIAWENMNEGDAFILDVGKIVFVWIGIEANRTEKIKAAEIGRGMRDDRGNSACVIVNSTEEETMSDQEKQLFNSHLRLDQKAVKAASEVPPDTEVLDRVAGAQIKLYLCKDDNGTLTIKEVKNGKLHRKDLDPDLGCDSFIVDNGEAGVWVWCGRKSSQIEKNEAMRNAKGFAKRKNYSDNISIKRVFDGSEPALFRQLFTWPPDRLPGQPTDKQKRRARTVQARFDAATLHSEREMAADTQMVDDGSGTVRIWRIENFELKPLDMKYFGQFYGGDCYVILYTYLVNGSENYIIYFWLGLKSSQDEQGSAALWSVNIDDQYGGKPVQIRVVQGKEPPHFMAMFGGKMMIFKGGKAGWTKGEDDEDGRKDGTYLMQVRGTSELNTKAVQVDCRGASLNSNDSFVLFTKTTVYVWVGKGCTGDEKEMAKHIANMSKREPVLVPEGQEKQNFWDAIGGKEDYVSEKVLSEDSEYPPRLFQASNASGRFVVEEIYNFNQQDLVIDDVVLLDAGHTIFVWIGEGANKEEKDTSVKTALEYIKTDPKGRDEDTPVVRIKQGYEPPTFTGFFGVWDKDMWSKGKTFEELCKEVGESNTGIELVTESSLQNGEASFSNVAKHPYELLKDKKTEEEGLPKGVDPSKKEIYLNEEEFQTNFGLAYSDFLSLPAWKQQSKKKSLGLF